MSIVDKIKDIISRFTVKRLPEEQIPSEIANGGYRYSDIIDYFHNKGEMEKFYQELDKLYSQKEEYMPSEVHGIEHTARVTFLADVLATIDKLDKHTKQVLLVAARYHDIGRTDDRETKEHGAIGAEKADELGYLKGFSRKDREVIKFAIEQHSLSTEENEKALEKIPKRKREYYKTILSYLKDADALDRVRIVNKDMKLDPSRLRTQTAKKLVHFAEENFKEFSKIKLQYKFDRAYLKQTPEVKEICDYLIDETLDIDDIINNIEKYRELRDKGVLQNIEEKRVALSHIIENENRMYAVSQIESDDFEILRKQGINITYETFLDIVSLYRDGAMQELRENGMLLDIFSKDTYEKYKKRETFRDMLDPTNISDYELLSKINENSPIKLSQEDFEKNYLLYKKLYQKNSLGFSVLVSYEDVNKQLTSVHGILENMKLMDFYVLWFDYYCSLTGEDIIKFAQDISPEMYKNIMETRELGELFKYNASVEKDRENFDRYFEIVQNSKRNISKEDFISYFKLYREVIEASEDILNVDGIENYRIGEVYMAISRIREAQSRFKHSKDVSINITNKNILNLLEVAEKTDLFNVNLMDTKEFDNIIKFLAQDETLKDNPNFINYVSRRNKVYQAETIEDVFGYNAFCMDKILGSNDLSYEAARYRLINSLFKVKIQEFTYYLLHQENEINIYEMDKNIINELYFYQKYVEEGKIEVSEDETEINQAISNLISIMDTVPTIEAFKKRLSECYDSIKDISFDDVMQKVQERMQAFSKQDIIEKLEGTEKDIEDLDISYVTYLDEEIPYRTLSKQPYSLGITTVMPAVSSVAQRLMKKGGEKLVRDTILNRPLNPNNRCICLANEEVNANLFSILRTDELRYAYVPHNTSQISMSATHDLYTTERSSTGHRAPHRNCTQNRSFEDLVLGTTELHNETVMDEVYPRFIVCYDDIGEIALEKYKMIKKFYDEQGIEQDLDIVLIKERDEYLPQIEANLQQDFDTILNEISENNGLSEEMLEKFFNKRERNIILRTIQSIGSHLYRLEEYYRWKEGEGQKEICIQKLDKLLLILEKAIEVVPEKYLGDINDQVELLLEDYQGGYGFNIVQDIDKEKLKKIKGRIMDRISPEEQKEKSINKKVIEIDN